MQLVKGDKCVVIGLGKSGMAAVRFLHELGLQVAVSEYRQENEIDAASLSELRSKGVAIETGGHREEFFADAGFIVPSPGVPLELPVIRNARQRGARVTGELALAADRITAPVIGVTGSNGKTTVTSLIGYLLEADNQKVFVGGNIGTPVLENLCRQKEIQSMVLELSSFQLEIGGHFRPDIGLLLNLSPDHIDRHGTMERYVAAKRLIFANQGKGDVAIVGGDDELVMEQQVTTAEKVLRFGGHPLFEAVVQDNGVMVRKGVFDENQEEHYDLSGTALSSYVNRLNAAAAILAARAHGCDPDAVRKGLAGFAPPAHRMSMVAEIEGVRYVDDSKGTNIGAVAAALASCGDRVILIAGGRDKDSDFALLAEPVKKNVRQMILIGEAAGRIEKQLGSMTRVSRASSLEKAVLRAAKGAQKGDTVLLSPGCASFDMFSGYAHRGEVFRRAVHALQKNIPECQ